MAVPFSPLFVAPRVMPQGTPNVLGNLIASWDQGQQVFQQNQANDLARQYADLQLGQGQQGSEGPTLGNLVVQPQAYSGTAPVTPVQRGGALPPVGPSVGSAMPSEAGYSLGGQVGAPIPTGVGFAAQPGFDAITYDYGPNTVRNQPVNPQLATALNNAARIAGVDQIVIGSGGQPGIGQGGNRTGSTRHDHGNAADLRLVAGGRELDFTNPADQAVFSAFVQAARAQGVTGIGAGTDYMGNNTIHMGYGPEAVWGAGGQGENAPEWLRQAYGAIGAVNQMAAAPSGQAQRQAYAAGAAPSPFTPAMASVLSQMAANPNTREFAFQEIARLTQAATVEYGFMNAGDGVIVRTDPRTGTVEPAYMAPQAGGPQFIRYRDPTTGFTGMMDTTTGDIQWDPAHIQPAGAAGPPETINGIGPQGETIQLVYAPDHPNANEFGYVQMGGARPPEGMSLQVDPVTGEVMFTQGPGALNMNQSAAVVYAGRMTAANQILAEVEGQGTELWPAIASRIPIFGNAMVSPEWRRYDQARRDFVNAVLRRESGAVISDSEFANANQQYFPQPYDDPATIEQKRRNRELATALIAAGIPGDINQMVMDAQAAAPSGPQGEPVISITTVEQYNALPPGTTYIDPDGNTRVKQ
jgi:hypothetical protein